MPTLTTYDGLEVAVSVHGPDDAPATVLMAHCWTSDQDDWRYQVRDLLAAFGHQVRIVAWDHRGHGLSSPTPRAACTIPHLARDMADVIDRFAPAGPLVVAGHSIGAMTTMALAESRPELWPERIVGTVLVSTSSGGIGDVDLGLGPAGEVIKDQIPRILAFRSRTLSKRARRRAPIIERQVFSRIVFGRPQRLRDVALAVEGLVNCPGDSVAGFFDDMTHRHERTAVLEVIGRAPSHVLVGAADRLTPPGMSRRMVAALGGDTELTIAPGAGHMLPLERDELVSDAIAAMVRRAI